MGFKTLYVLLAKNIFLPVNHNSINLKGKEDEYDFESLFDHDSVEDKSGSISNKESKENEHSNKGYLKQGIKYKISIKEN